MKNRFLGRFGGGLLLLIALSIAVIADQTMMNADEPAATEATYLLDESVTATVERERLAELEALSAVVETVLDIPILIDASTEESEATTQEIADADGAAVQ